jgi:cytoskeleton protein RodZ
MTQTIGQRLKAEREEKHLTLEKVFEATRIRVQYLQALEADDLSVMPSPVQARGYLRNYAEYLGLDVERVLTELRATSAQPADAEVIGPADETPAIPQQDDKPLETQPAAPISETPEVVEDQPASSPSVMIPIKPTSVRRKKANGSTSQPGSAPDAPQAAYVETPTRRRGRKKAEPKPEVVPIVEERSLVAEEDISAPVPPAELISQPESVEELPASAEVAPEPVAEDAIDVQDDTPQPADARDSRWLAWLNRVRSGSSARRKHQPPAQDEAPIIENEPVGPMVSSKEPDATKVEVQNGSLENSNEILKEIGRELRSRRELLSLHLEEVERNTRVKAHYLSALEKGALDELPSTVQTRGMLSNYATFLDLDVDALLLRFADALQARHRERNPQKPPRKAGQPIVANMPPIRSFIAGDMVFGVGMAVLLVGFAIWGVNRVLTIQSQREIKPTAPSISDVLLASPDPSSLVATSTALLVEAFPGEATATVEIPTQNVNAQVQLNLVAVERTYMRVVVDGKEAFNGRVVPGNAYPFEAEDQIEVLVGSGAAIRIVYNGRDMGLMGTFGQVLNNIYTNTEIITPTAMPTATPTITPTPTNTVPPTATSRFTSTPVPSATSRP